MKTSHERNVLMWIAASPRRTFTIVAIILAMALLLAGCGGSVTGPTVRDAPTPNEALVLSLAECYGSYHGLDVQVVFHDENRGDGGCAWAWNLSPDLNVSRECINSQQANIDVAWIVAHEVCHMKGLPDDYNEENSTLRFCINTTLAQSGCAY